MTVHILVLVVLVLMTEQDVNTVLTELVVPVEQLVYVQSTVTCPVLVTTTTYVLSVTTNWSCEVGLVCIEYIVSYISSKLEVIEECPLEVAT